MTARQPFPGVFTWPEPFTLLPQMMNSFQQADWISHNCAFAMQGASLFARMLGFKAGELPAPDKLTQSDRYANQNSETLIT